MNTVHYGDTSIDNIYTDLLILGAGSGGFGTLVGALRQGNGSWNITMIEKNEGFGGISTFGGVNCWEPGVGGPGVHTGLARKLSELPMASCTGATVWTPTCEKPWALSVEVHDAYETTLRRSGMQGDQFRRFHFEPDSMSDTMKSMAAGNGRVNLLFGTEFVSVETVGDRIRCIYAVDKKRNLTYRIYARLFVDCSADIILARAAGCSYSSGEDASHVYNEPSAPDVPGETVNGATLLFRIAPVEERQVEDIPNAYQDWDVSGWADENLERTKLASCFNQYPNGDINVNMLPTLDGVEYMRLGDQAALELCKARVYHYWHWLQTEKGLTDYRFKGFFPMLGVRETYRLTGCYVLNEMDIRAGVWKQGRKAEWVAFGDHALDTHGKTKVKGPVCGELESPYGIPYSCLITREIDNLLVACRGASFTHIAASSCRLSRTMLALGEAAGTAVVMALEAGVSPWEVNTEFLRQRLEIPRFEAKIAEVWKA